MGAVIRRLMNRHNARMNAFAVRELQLVSSDRVLEIGFGGGVTLPALMRTAAFVAGIDRSHDVVAWARRRFAEAITTGRAAFRQGSVEALPYETATFDKACTVNTVYFWTSLDAGFAELHRVLAPRGRIAVGFLPKERMERMGMPDDIFTTRAPQEIVAALTRAGFTEATAKRPDPRTAWTVVVASR
jgi:ubiquinone/menaquinone biosynthesis C-methylase UbiE